MQSGELKVYSVVIQMQEKDYNAFMGALKEKGLVISFEAAVEGIINVLSEDENHGIISNLIDWSMENEMDLDSCCGCEGCEECE